MGTLLSPEETGRVPRPCDAVPFRVFSAPQFLISSRGQGCGLRLFLENCTVDASIFCFLQSNFVVPSFIGHTVDALAPGAEEGRWSLRYAPGSRQPGCDPGVSEWGNPAAVMGRRARLNA